MLATLGGHGEGLRGEGSGPRRCRPVPEGGWGQGAHTSAVRMQPAC